jgi:hypothetical protein
VTAYKVRNTYFPQPLNCPLHHPLNVCSCTMLATARNILLAGSARPGSGWLPQTG